MEGVEQDVVWGGVGRWSEDCVKVRRVGVVGREIRKGYLMGRGIGG